MKLPLALLIILMTFGCGDDNTENNGKTRQELADDCSGFTETECKENSECTPFYGAPFDFTAMCQTKSEEFIICGLAEASECNNSVISFVTGPEANQCWQQSSPCFGLAPGYSQSQSVACADPAPDCP